MAEFEPIEPSDLLKSEFNWPPEISSETTLWKAAMELAEHICRMQKALGTNPAATVKKYTGESVVLEITDWGSGAFLITEFLVAIARAHRRVRLLIERGDFE